MIDLLNVKLDALMMPKKQKMPEIKYKIMVALGTEIPRLTNWWCMCSKSGLKIFFRFNARRVMLKQISINGIAKINTIAKIDTVDFKTPKMDITPNK